MERVVFTHQDYLALPNDGKRYEILDGDLHVTPAPTTRHQRILVILTRLLDDFVVAHGLGIVLVAPCDVVLDDTTVVQPDLIFVSKPRISIVKETHVAGGPDLVIEVLSPTTAKLDRSLKLAQYEKHGVASYWILDPEKRELEERVLVKGSYSVAAKLSGPATFRPQILPGLTLELGKVWV